MNPFYTILTQSAQQDGSMGFMLDAVLWIMLLAYGGYALYVAIRLRCTCMLFQSKLLYPGNCTPENCVDEDGFFYYILPRITIWGVSMVAMGLLVILNTYVLKFNNLWVELATMILPVAVIIWYIVIQHKAAKRFWQV